MSFQVLLKVSLAGYLNSPIPLSFGAGEGEGLVKCCLKKSVNYEEFTPELWGAEG